MEDQSVEVKQEPGTANVNQPFAELDALLAAQDLKPATQDDTRGNS